LTNENEYIRKFIQGDDEAFSLLFFEYYPKVKHFIIRLIKSDVFAEDLAQDIFAKIWINRENLSNVHSFNAYIFQMTKNRVLNHIKSNTVRSIYKNSINTEEPSITLEEEFIAKETQLIIELVVQKMPSRKRRVFEMSRYEGLKNEEIATKLNISKKTVENHLNMAINEIKRSLVLFCFLFIQ